MCAKIKCKDYFIIKIRYYADDRLLKKHSGEQLPKQHYDRAKLYVDCKIKFIEKVLKIEYKELVLKYFLYSFDCAFEQMEEEYGIIFLDGEGWATFMVPKKHIKIIKWLKNNILLPYKVISKTNISWLNIGERNLKWRRQMSKEFMDKNPLNIKKTI